MAVDMLAEAGEVPPQAAAAEAEGTTLQIADFVQHRVERRRRREELVAA